MVDSCVKTHRIRWIVVNGTHQHDWQRVLDLQRQYPDIVLAQIGLHPWWVESQSTSNPKWFDDLKNMLTEHPHVGVGECGLDKSGSRRRTFQEQRMAFEKQIRLALELQRPLSVHCVRVYGTMYDYIKEIGGRIPVLLHGWTGSPEMTRLFAKLDNVFFSLNLTLLNMTPEAGVDMVRFIPGERRLVESDGPDGRVNGTSLEAWYGAFPSLRQEMAPFIHSSDANNTSASVILTGKVLSLITGESCESIHAQATRGVKHVFAHCLQ